MRAGLYDYVESYLEEIVSEGDYHDFKWLSTANFIWYAEKIGRFDIAKQLSAIVLDNKKEYSQDIAFNINYGHILLMEDGISEAFGYYQYAEKLCKEQFPDSSEKEVREFVMNNIQNDLEIFRWMEVGKKDNIDIVYNQYNIPKREFLTQLSDSSTTKDFVNDMEGDWALMDSSVVMHYYSQSPLCQYKFFCKNNDGELEELQRSMTNIRISQRGEKLYIEEYNQEKDIDSICCGEIVSKSTDELSILIINNGKDTDNGTIRVYHRIFNDN